MKKITKIVSLMLAFVLAFAMAMPASADWITDTSSLSGTASLKITHVNGDKLADKDKLANRKFRVWQILNATVDHEHEHVGGAGDTSNKHVSYTIPDSLEDIFTAWFSEAGHTHPRTISGLSLDNMVNVANVEDAAVSTQAVSEEITMSKGEMLRALAAMDPNIAVVDSPADEPMIMPMALDEAAEYEILTNLAEYDKNTELSGELAEFARFVLTKLHEKATISDDLVKIDVYKAAEGGSQPANVTYNLDDSYTVSNLPYGYYLIEEITESDKNVDAYSAVLLERVLEDENETANVKLLSPTVEKTVGNTAEIAGDTPSNGTGGAWNTTQIGEDVFFKLKIGLPDATGYDKYLFEIEDTFNTSQFTYEPQTIEVKYFVNETASEATSTLAEGTDYSFSTSDGKLKWTIASKFIKDHSPDSTSANAERPYIVITYKLKLAKGAVMGSEGNKNHVELKYSNKPAESGSGSKDDPNEEDKNPPEGDEPPTNTTEDNTKTYVFSLELNKIDGENDPLENATFRLYKKSTEGNLYAKVNDENKKITWNKLSDVSDPSEFTTGTAGKISIEGLAAGTYYLEEIAAPDGFNKMSSDIEFTIKYDSLGDSAEDVVFKAEASSKFGVGSVYKEVTGVTGNVYGYVISVNNNDTANIIDNKASDSVTGGAVKLTVANFADGELPETGGIGRAIIYTLGVVLVLGAAALFVIKKRRENNA